MIFLRFARFTLLFDGTLPFRGVCRRGYQFLGCCLQETVVGGNGGSLCSRIAELFEAMVWMIVTCVGYARGAVIEVGAVKAFVVNAEYLL